MSKPSNIAVLGAGRSGQAAAALALDLGNSVRVYETGLAKDSEQASLLEERVRHLGASWSAQLSDKVEESLIVASPGLDPRSDLARLFRSSGVEMIGELEFGWRHTEAPAIAITGTNGKTTTTEMIGHVLRLSGFDAPLGGNHGQPLCSLVLERERLARKRPDWLLLEVSSFQSEDAPSFSPRVVVWTNFAADHLDRYPDIRAYREAKLRIFANLDRGDWAVLPLDEEIPIKDVPIVRFGLDPRAEFHLANGRIVAHGKELGEFSRCQVGGRHNALNALAALAACEVAGVDPEEAFHHLSSFRAAAHRYERLAVVSGIEYINDSKATNLHAMGSALTADTKPLRLLVGGFDKGLDWSEVLALLPGRVRCVYAYGQSAAQISQAWAQTVELECHESLEQAFAAAVACANSGEQILLSPGTSSFDQFTNYAERGETFRQLVEAQHRKI